MPATTESADGEIGPVAGQQILASAAMPVWPLVYRFHPRAFAREHVVTLDAEGIASQVEGAAIHRLRWDAIEEVHIEPATAGADDRLRFVVHVKAGDRPRIDIDSVDVRSAVEFVHKSDEFLAVLSALHRVLLPRAAEVRFLFGMRRGVGWAWRIALGMTVIAALGGVAAGIHTGQFEALFGSGAMLAMAVGGIAKLRGRGVPRPYDPAEMSLEADLAPHPP